MIIQSTLNQAISSVAGLLKTGASISAKEPEMGKASNDPKIEAVNETVGKKTAAAQDQRRNGRRVFKEYLATEPTSLGVNVGDLPPNMQKLIAQQYTKSQRKTMMDRKDASNEQK